LFACYQGGENPRKFASKNWEGAIFGQTEITRNWNKNEVLEIVQKKLAILKSSMRI